MESVSRSAATTATMDPTRKDSQSRSQNRLCDRAAIQDGGCFQNGTQKRVRTSDIPSRR